jgi:hypothetical protein
LPKMRLSTAIGNLVEVTGLFIGVYVLVIARGFTVIPVKFVLYIVAWCCLLFFPHCLAHYVVGRLVGVRFRYYSLRKSSARRLKSSVLSTVASKFMVFTLHVEGTSLRSISRERRFAMFCSGAVASMVLPFVAAVASFGDLPTMLSVLLLLLAIGNVIFDLYFSPKVGDISKAISSG